MHGRGAVGVVGRHVLQRRDLALHPGAHRVHDVFPHQSASVGQAVWKQVALGVEEDPGGREGARGEDHDACAGLLVEAGVLIDVVDAGRPSPRVDRHLTHHGVGDEAHIASGQGRWDQDGGGLKIRLDGAPPAARRGPEAGRPRAHGLAEHALGQRVVRMDESRKRLVVLHLGENGDVGRDHWNPQFRTGALFKQFVGARGRRSLKDPRGRTGRVLEPLVGPVHADEPLGLVVVWGHVLVRHGPVEAQTIP